MNPNLIGLVDPGALAVARAHAHSSLNRNPYFTAQSALTASRVVEIWKSKDWKMQTFRSDVTQIAPRTLREKLKGGIEWNIANTTGAEQEFWRNLRASIRFSIKGETLTIFKAKDILDSMSDSVAAGNADIRAEFINWATRALPGKTFHRPGLELDAETIEWFKSKLNEPRWTDAFVGFARANEVRIVRTTAPITEDLT